MEPAGRERRAGGQGVLSGQLAKLDESEDRKSARLPSPSSC